MTHKFWIKVPKNVEEALVLDKENGNDLWWKAIQEEMSAVKLVYRSLMKMKPTNWFPIHEISHDAFN